MIMATKINQNWKEVTIGGFTGILLGSAGTMFANNIHQAHNSGETEEINVEEDVQNEEQQETTTTTNIPNNGSVANNVNDEMSFSQAFAAARAEVGAGGYFVWHGNVYGTYYANEWNSMSQEQQAQFSSGSSNIPHTDYAHTEHLNQNTSVHTTSSETAQTVQDTTTSNEEDVDFQILGVEHANIDGEHDSIIGAASVNGQAVYFIDVDGQDNEFEYMVADANANNQIEENEFVDISEQHMSVSSFEQIAQANNPQNEVEQYYASNENLPDYVNDADTGNLA